MNKAEYRVWKRSQLIMTNIQVLKVWQG